MAAAVDSIFDEDEVCRKIDDDRYEFGLVVESSEYVSSDEDDDEEDRLKKGTVRVAWHPEGKETIEEEKKLILADRSLMPGDVVRRIIEGKSSPRGFVQDMKVLCHVNIKGTNKYIYNVDSKDISSGSYEDPSNKYFKNDHPDVTMDSWIGKIEEVYEAVTLLFPDGAMCKVVEAEDLHYEFDSINDRCKDEAPDSTFSSEGMFYKGKILRGKIGDLQGAEWFQPTKSYSSKVAKKNPRLMVTVRIEEVEVTSVKVHWLFRGFGTPENSSNSMEVPPAKVVPPKLS
ncbi:hypothetical protein FSP39_004336 [Pinctada imbricata]|uniref:UBE2O-like tandem tSH3-B domain-containing protein n=1 Tax=Pinctada imbricata TaxID=66713 RepID=A0AA89C0G9_PINIB|nr:hypothetical protein FSP39_004336 [Pinctada imbricata]